MSTKIATLAKKLDMKTNVLIAYIKDFGFEIDAKNKTIEDELAEIVEDELKQVLKKQDEMDTAEIYDEIVGQEMEKDLIKSQRKQTAGKEKTKVKKSKEKEEVKTEKKISTITETAAKKDAIEIEDSITIKEFAEKTNISAAKIIGELMKNGIIANINQEIDYETISIIALDLGINIKRKRSAAKIEDMMEGNLSKLLYEDDKSVLVTRPPVVSIMGHVDHGKTKLLDTIRNTHVIDQEAGGITQHIGAYQVEKNGHKITFIDTPGHEAFTAMRARGAKATDIAILVVAADEGVKPQTIEAINHAKDADIPIIVAINKIDRPGANPEKVKGELVEHGLQAESWGGNVIMVPISALTGEGIDKLLDMILLTAEMEDLKANPVRPAVATVIEAHLDANLGPVATVVINTGSLKIGDNIIIGPAYGKVKRMQSDRGKHLKMLCPSDTAQIAGLSETVHAGDILQVVSNEKEARQKAIAIRDIMKVKNIFSQALSVKDLASRIKSGNLKTLKIILKADTQGSLEAIKQSLDKIPQEKVSLKIIHNGIGAITESDVMMAAAGGALVIGFQVETPVLATKAAEKHSVEILSYRIIYKLLEDVKNLLEGLLEDEILEIETGKVEIIKIFFKKKHDYILGCKVTNGKIERKSTIKIFRNNQELGKGDIFSLQKVDKKMEEVKEGNECGLKFSTSCELIEGDTLIAYKLEKKERSL
ncbi:MAG: translation initiation factor IF-2, translation initiation factor IF-2 [Candidatus Peregrinibacteria bacterium GW2011_GWF2_33_10]|nr:MAG: translation initiation factor IF-2, translation initiation factor IF-2 [Candidatus Peregrinibacteria bacterium GW2011_GWF2_33_10]OGJ45308.1 MAG: translation initiation factor IF-2 [Candidatus Peregrinibacteria bacterium RIFOXYA12_FULL_33_12]OGJ45400.1 MAG: translation initiation factor IF-2 [Candidatus Peregrinibacteria bacterium RIFOXYA2_FULL_33_21]OGJ51003.1 MAG: translation initiation factor IF-2 [Candidatus Peregrinibacteria bacterium RIFOXYB2_FULL_33_20]